jgi:DNA-directed RNA polymerase sigma subunit (sigma70/sigma32)
LGREATKCGLVSRKLKHLESEARKAFKAYYKGQTAMKKLVEANLRVVFIIAIIHAFKGHYLLDHI